MKVINHRKCFFFITVFFITLLSLYQQYFWPAARTIFFSTSNTLLNRFGQSEVGLCSFAITFHTLSGLCFVVRQLPAPPDSCYPHSDSYHLFSFSCGLPTDESAWGMGEELGQLTGEQLATTVTDTFMSCPARLKCRHYTVEGMHVWH